MTFGIRTTHQVDQIEAGAYMSNPPGNIRFRRSGRRKRQRSSLELIHLESRIHRLCGSKSSEGVQVPLAGPCLTTPFPDTASRFPNRVMRRSPRANRAPPQKALEMVLCGGVSGTGCSGRKGGGDLCGQRGAMHAAKNARCALMQIQWLAVRWQQPPRNGEKLRLDWHVFVSLPGSDMLGRVPIL